MDGLGGEESGSSVFGGQEAPNNVQIAYHGGPPQVYPGGVQQSVTGGQQQGHQVGGQLPTNTSQQLQFGQHSQVNPQASQAHSHAGIDQHHGQPQGSHWHQQQQQQTLIGTGGQGGFPGNFATIGQQHNLGTNGPAVQQNQFQHSGQPQYHIAQQHVQLGQQQTLSSLHTPAEQYVPSQSAGHHYPAMTQQGPYFYSEQQFPVASGALQSASGQVLTNIQQPQMRQQSEVSLPQMVTGQRLQSHSLQPQPDPNQQQQQLSHDGQCFFPSPSQVQYGPQQHFTSSMAPLNGQPGSSAMQIPVYGQQMLPDGPSSSYAIQQRFTVEGQPQVGSHPVNAAGFGLPQHPQGSQHLHGPDQQFQPLSEIYLSNSGPRSFDNQHFVPQSQFQSQAQSEASSNEDSEDDDSSEDDGYYGEDEGDGDYEDDGESEDDGRSETAAENQDVNDGMVEDPLYRQAREQLETWQRQSRANLTEAQKSQFATYAAWKKQKSSNVGQKRLADLGDCNFEEDLVDEAVRATKRQKKTEPERSQFYMSAQKVYTCGPQNEQNEPEPMDENGAEAGDEGRHEELDGLALDAEILGLPAVFKGKLSGKTLSLVVPEPAPIFQPLDPNFRLIESICSDFWLMIEITKHLSVKEIVKVYSVSRTFHDAVNSRFQSTIAAWAQYMSPAGWEVFLWKLYGKYCILDPAGKPWAIAGPVAFPRPAWAGPPRPLAMQTDVRHVPGFKYLAMLEQRERRTRDILACLARSGHRLPKTMHITLKKIWMLMDMPTCNMRRSFIHHPDMWTDRDLYNAQMFFVKLSMRFNEPVFGPDSTALADTFLGAREGLTPLWKLLRRKAYLQPDEVLERSIRYHLAEDLVDHYGLIGEPYFGVEPWDLGREHLEGWGAGNIHLRRPDELVMEECVRREIDLKPHLIFMVFWGHVSWERRMNLVPTEDEMYMSDDELPPLPRTGDFSAHGMFGRCGNVPFDYDNWQPKHAMKARWDTLKRAEKLAIIRDDEDEQLRGLPFEEANNDGLWDVYNVNDPQHPKEAGEPGEPEKQPASAEKHFVPRREDFYGVDNGDDGLGDDDDAASVQTFFGPEIARTHNVTFPLFDSDQDEEDGSIIEKITYEYIDEEPLPMPDTVTDPETIANWDDMDPYLQQKVIEEEKRLAEQDVKDSKTLYATNREELDQLDPELPISDYDLVAQVRQGWERQREVGQTWPSVQQVRQQQQQRAQPHDEETGQNSHHYDYPGITDPLLLSLLRKYDRFAPDDFRCDEDGKPLPRPVKDSDGDHNMDDPQHGMEQGEAAAADDSEGKGSGSPDFAAMDDEKLIALADVDYDEEQLDFDLERYEDFLDCVGDDGGFKDSERRLRRKHDDEGGEEDEDEDEGVEDTWMADVRDEIADMAHEKDLDDEAGDDIPLPKYDFRKY